MIVGEIIQMNYILSTKLLTKLMNDYFRQHGVYLEEYLGVKEWAVNKIVALKIINEAKENNVAILGGDVLIKKDGKYQYKNENWHIEKQQNESQEEYATRSIIKAKEYIENYPEGSESIYYVLVMDKNHE
jgi:hypothetical protein